MDGAAQRVGDAAPDEELLVIDGLGCLLGGHDGRGGPGWELNQFLMEIPRREQAALVALSAPIVRDSTSRKL